MYSNILDTVKTNLDREELLYEINQIKSALYESAKNLEDVLKSKVRAFFADTVRQQIQEGADLEKYFSGLVKALNGLEEVKLEVALEPTHEEIEVISNWLNKSTGGKTLISFDVKPNILGGATVSFKGKYFDGSLLKILDKTLEESRDALIKQIYLQK